MSHLRALGSLIPILVVFAAYQLLSWFMFRRFSSFGWFAFVLPAFVYFQTRNTFVEVSEHGLRVRSHRSSSKDPIVLAWSEITDAVLLEQWLRFSTTVEVRSGQRFAWVHVGMLDDLDGFVAAVRARAGADSILMRTLQTLKARTVLDD